MRNLSLVLASVSAAAALYATPVFAEPTYAGIGCLASGTDVTDIVRFDNVAANQSSSQVTFRCPVVKHTSPGKISAAASVQVIDRRTNAHVLCQIRALSADASQLRTRTRQTTDAEEATAPLELVFDGAPLLGFAGGHYALKCEVPGSTTAGERSGVVTYDIPEL